jgi:anti-sigma factor RsiW
MSDEHATDRRRLIAALLGPGAPELTCEECFEQLDRYVDLELAGADPERAVPGMRAHLAGCPACLEDHASLAAFVAAEAPPPPIAA